MSSTTPEHGPRDGDVSDGQTSGRPDQAAPDGPLSARDGAVSGRPASAADRAAMRTSLAERFASAKAGSPETGADRTRASGPESTARMASTDDTGRTESTRESGAPTGRVPVGAGATAAGGSPRGARPQARPVPAQSAPAQPVRDPEASSRPVGPRQVRLSLARIDPWSVMKLAFLLSIAVGVGIVVATAAVWYVLDTMHVFADIQGLLDSLGSESFLNLMEYAQFDRVLSMAAVVAVVDILLLTALATLGAFLYNIVAALVGGLHLTLTDD